MKKRIIALLAASFALMAPLRAQTLTSGYFLEGNSLRPWLNPAFEGEHNYIAFPLGNVTLGVNSNVGVSNFLYPYNRDGYALTTFMSSTVDANQFLNALPQQTRIDEHLNLTLMAIGAKTKNGYNTFNVSLHENLGFFMPKEFFELAKRGLSKETYSFSGLGAKAQAYGDIAFGHSHRVTDNLKIGGRAHLFLGIGSASVVLDKLNMNLNETSWTAEAQATGRLALMGNTKLALDEDGFPEDIQFSPGLNSFGLGLDLGAEYNMGNLVDGLSLSMALTDLGFIKWPTSYAIGSHEAAFEYTGLGEIDPDNMNLEEQVSEIGESALNLMNLYFQPGGRRSTKLSPMFRFGADYKMPFWNKMSASLLYTQQFDQLTPYSDGRLFVNIAPLRFLELSANVGASTYGTEFGWMFNLHPKGIQLFFGSDFTVFKVTPQYLPVNRFNASLCLGVNIAF